MADHGAVRTLQVEIVKRTDGGAVLRCTRADGSVSWQRIGGAQAGFFPRHDLTHVAVETVLGTRQSFLRLVADGWEIEETTGKGARGPIPPEALLVERLVGMLDVERGTGSDWTAAEFAEQITAADPRLTSLTSILTDSCMAAIRARRAELFSQWDLVPAGESLSIHLPALSITPR